MLSIIAILLSAPLQSGVQVTKSHGTSPPKRPSTPPQRPHHLHAQIRIPNPPNRTLVLLQRGLDVILEHLVDDLRRPAKECRGIHQHFQLVEDWLEETGLAYPLDEIVGFALLFDDGAGLVGEDAVKEWVSEVRAVKRVFARSSDQSAHWTYRMCSCASCREWPLLTMAMMMFSVAMNGSSRSMRCLITALLTTRPEEMLLSCDIGSARHQPASCSRRRTSIPKSDKHQRTETTPATRSAESPSHPDSSPTTAIYTSAQHPR